MVLQWSSMWNSRFPVGEGNTKRVWVGCGCSASKPSSSLGTGTSRSSQRFGEKLKSGLAVTRNGVKGEIDVGPDEVNGYLIHPGLSARTNSPGVRSASPVCGRFSL